MSDTGGPDEQAFDGEEEDDFKIVPGPLTAAGSAVAEQLMQGGDVPEYHSRLDEMTMEETETTGTSLGRRIINSWKDMRGHTRGLINENLDEHRLLFYVLLSDIIFFVSFTIRALVSPFGYETAQVGLLAFKILVAVLLLRTIFMYVLSLVLQLGSKAVGGKGTWKETRVGVFWGALVAAPFEILLAALGGMISNYGAGIPWLLSIEMEMAILLGGFVPLFWFISLGLAEAQKFKSHLPSFGILMAVGAIGAISLALFGLPGSH
ncbi:hypothetical protein [Halovulum sp. GXIMD14793]